MPDNNTAEHTVRPVTAAQTAAGFDAVMGVLYIEVMIGSIVSSYHGR
jgi:hypothetical protein